MGALDYFADAEAAAAYVEKRRDDAVQVVNLLKWELGFCSGMMRAELYGHSIVWDTTGRLCGGHAYEIKPLHDEDIERGNLAQVVAYILAANW